METLQRIVSRQWTDFSQGTSFKRLKSFDESRLIHKEDAGSGYDGYGEDGLFRDYSPLKTSATSPQLQLQYSPDLSYISLPPTTNGMHPLQKAVDSNGHLPTSHSTGELMHTASFNNSEWNNGNGHHNNRRLETGQLDARGLEFGEESGRFRQFQQPFRKVIKVSNAVREKLPGSSRKLNSQVQQAGTEEEKMRVKKQKSADAVDSQDPNGNLAEDNETTKGMMNKFRKQTKIMDIRGKLGSTARNKKSDSLNLLTSEEPIYFRDDI